MKISIIVNSDIEKNTKEFLEDIAIMIDDLSEHYPSIIDRNDVEVTIKN